MTNKDKVDDTTETIQPVTTSLDNELVSKFEIEYNSETYNLENSNNNKLVVKKKGLKHYQTEQLSTKKPIIRFTYNDICIESNNIHCIYVILQYIFGKRTLNELSKHDWDYTKWKVQITSNKKLPDWANILNCLLNLGEFNKPFDINKISENVKLNDSRGWGGERPREVYYKLGFPLYTSKTKKSLKNTERLFECPFPICKINPERKAILSDLPTEKKCFTCGCKEGEKDYFGNICNFEKGHFDPHIHGGADTAGHQCKWCNSFYKDKITWDSHTGKPKFNSYAILRDEAKSKIIQDLKHLGFTPKDLE